MTEVLFPASSFTIDPYYGIDMGDNIYRTRSGFIILSTPANFDYTGEYQIALRFITRSGFGLYNNGEFEYLINASSVLALVKDNNSAQIGDTVIITKNNETIPVLGSYNSPLTEPYIGYNTLTIKIYCGHPDYGEIEFLGGSAIIVPPFTAKRVVTVNIQGGGKVAIPIPTPVASQKSVIMKLQSGEKVAIPLRTPVVGDTVATINLQGGDKSVVLLNRDTIIYYNSTSLPCHNLVGGPNGDFQYGKIDVSNSSLDINEYMYYFADSYLRLEGISQITIKYRMRTRLSFPQLKIGDKTIRLYMSPYSEVVLETPPADHFHEIRQNPLWPGYDTITLTSSDIGMGSQQGPDPALFWYSDFILQIDPKISGVDYFAYIELGPITPTGTNTNHWDKGVITIGER